MRKALCLFALLGTLMFASTAMAATEAPAAGVSEGHSSWFFPNAKYTAMFGAAIGAGLVAAGAARGIGNIGASGVEAIARQPQAAGDIRGLAVLTAAFIEGVALFGVVLCLLIVVL